VSVPAGQGGEAWRRRGEVVTRQIAGECILVPVRGDLANLQRVYGLSSVAERVWETLGGGDRSFAALLAAVESGFEVDRETAARDLAELLASLEREGLVERAGGGA
jgi:hypothetical protein